MTFFFFFSPRVGLDKIHSWVNTFGGEKKKISFSDSRFRPTALLVVGPTRHPCDQPLFLSEGVGVGGGGKGGEVKGRGIGTSSG